MDPGPFAHLSRTGYDVMVVWDYTSLELDATPMRHYDEIVVVAWSLGVFMAAATANHLPVPVTARIAVAGTLMPIDDLRGVPTSKFWNTLAGLADGSMTKLLRRMCRDTAQYEEFMQHMPQRTIDDICTELEAVPRHVREADVTRLGKRWDYALVPQDDRMVPSDNQRRAWEGQATTVLTISGSHMPSLARILNNYIIDKELVRRRFGRAAASDDQPTAIQHDMALRLSAQLSALCPDELAQAGNVLEIGSGTGHLTRALRPLLPVDCEMRLWDLVDSGCQRPEGSIFEQCDAEMAIRRLPYRSLDMIVAGAALQWFNSPGAFLVRAWRALRVGGILAFSTFTRGNLREVATIAGDALPFIAYGRLDSLIPHGMEVVLMQPTTVMRYFDTPQQVLEHLRLNGVNAVASHAHPVEVIHRLVRNYPRVEMGPQHGRCPLTYCPIYVILRKTE